MHSGGMGNHSDDKTLLKAFVLVGVLVVVYVVVFYTVSFKKENSVADSRKLDFFQHIERGDIVDFGNGDIQMVYERVGDDILFKIPTAPGLAMSMDINSAARQAKTVIKYHPTGDAWTNAAHALMTGYLHREDVKTVSH